MALIAGLSQMKFTAKIKKLNIRFLQKSDSGVYIAGNKKIFNYALL